MTFDRRSGIGGSDAAVVLGYSPYRDPLDLWLEKTGHPGFKPKPPSPAMRWGTILEPVLREQYEREEGRQVRLDPLPDLEADAPFNGQPTYWAPNKVQYAHLDGWIDADVRGIWEGKTASDPSYWDDGVPIQYQIQVQQYMDIARAMWCDLSVLLPGGDFRTYRIDADPGAQFTIEQRTYVWWKEHVDAGTPPAEITDPAVLWPASGDGDPVVIDEDHVTMLIEEYADLVYRAKRDERRMREIRDEIEPMIKDAPGLIVPGYRVSFKSNRPTRKIGWEQIATAYENTLYVLDRYRDHLPEEARTHLAKDRIDAVRSLYTTTVRPARPFKVTPNKMEEA